MKIALVTSLSVLTFTHPAFADELCQGGPRDQWLSKEAIAELVSEMGYATDNYLLMIEDGCLEAKLIEDNKRIEIYFEPITGEVVRIKED